MKTSEELASFILNTIENHSAETATIIIMEETELEKIKNGVAFQFNPIFN